jgi:pimeloyl-ACP methyl ester carboxylesterase
MHWKCSPTNAIAIRQKNTATFRSNKEKMSKREPYPSPRLTGYTEINGHHVLWKFFGPETGTNVVLLHHGLGSIRSWKRQIPVLIEKGYNVLAYDRWGYGGSDPRPSFEAYFLHHEAEEALCLLQNLGIQQASFIGHSDGGSIAIILAARHPEVVQSLILIAAHIYVEPKMAKGLGLIKMASQQHPLSTVLEREHGDRSQILVQSWLDCWIQHGPQTLNLVDELRGVNCPTLVVQGIRDEHATPQHAEDIAAGIDKASLWLIPEVGHMPPQENSTEFNLRMVQFLEKNHALQNPLEKPGLEREDVH